MSILPLSGYLQPALDLLTLGNISVQDVEYVKVSGVEEAHDLGLRTVAAAIDAGNMKQLEVLFGQGNVGEGDLLIYIKTEAEELYILDQCGLGEPKRQSFLTYSGISFRIMAYQDWTLQAGIRVYQGRRHVQQQSLKPGIS